jgi:1-acyl-sn-glycerol-3-phosphate acyltransferase
MIILRATIKAILLLFIMVLSIMILSVMRSVSIDNSKVKKFLYTITAKLLAINIRVNGEVTAVPALLMSNHSSYVDVIILGSLVKNICFTPKSEVKDWFFIGHLTKMFDVIFVDRKPSRVSTAKNDIFQSLESGKYVSVFPEATTNDGRSLKKFKSSLFGLAEMSLENNNKLPVQPIAVKYILADDKPLGDEQWDAVAWYGDAEFFPHLWGFMKFSSLNVEVTFLPDMVIGEGGRKELSAKCEQLIRDELFKKGA